MPFENSRNLLLYATLAAVVGWSLLRDSDVRSIFEEKSHSEPQTLASDASVASELCIVSPSDGLHDRRVVDDQVRPASAQLAIALATASHAVGSTEEPAIAEANDSAPRPRVMAVEPINLAFSPDRKTIVVRFDPRSPLHVEIETQAGHDRFILSGKIAGVQAISDVKLDRDNSVTLTFTKEIPADNYTLKIGQELRSALGHTLGEEYTTSLIMPVGSELPTVSRGIVGPTGPNVEFGEYTTPRDFIDGFNPSDHVETRVSRLYYFRDAHRVAQIINRDVKSYNRAAVDNQQQLADKSRQIADQATDARRSKERRAVDAARRTREAEHEQQQAQQLAERAADVAALAVETRLDRQQELRDPNLDSQRRAALESAEQAAPDTDRKLESVADAARQRARAAYEKVQHLREEEAQLSEEWQASIAVEDRAREEQFRREVAAAQADPDTYAPGKPGSQDPVRQVSVSVIGEGLIQLRGPIKGINLIRTMINQIDAPVGQVKVGVHTVQINGEKGDRMEVVAGKIQRYIDHSRFLTLQSGEMFRKAIVQVAAEKALELGHVPGLTQEERDRSYLEAFFGGDFIRELEAIDSEFLATGNKLLSIHSMDSTSLASAMFVMALAKNTTRMQILQTFDGMMAAELPMAEQNYFEAGFTCDGKHKLFGKYCKRDEFQLLSANARFQSIRGMFNVEIADDDTMTPIQREFVRLAQIFKSRLIVEMELKQRVMERSVIEERLGDRETELKDAAKIEKAAKDKLRDAQEALIEARKAVLVAAIRIQAQFQLEVSKIDQVPPIVREATELAESFFDAPLDAFVESVFWNTFHVRTVDEYLAKLRKEPGGEAVAGRLALDVASLRRDALAPLRDDETAGDRLIDIYSKFLGALEREGETGKVTIPDTLHFQLVPRNQPLAIKVTTASGDVQITNDDQVTANSLAQLIGAADLTARILGRFQFEDPHLQQFADANSLLLRMKATREVETQLFDNLHRGLTAFGIYEELVSHVVETKDALSREMNYVIADLGNESSDANATYRRWIKIEEQIKRYAGAELWRDAKPLMEAAAGKFVGLIQANLEREFALTGAENARRPLDHKKFLDMLVDEMEDKYIELLEGTRAHTANIDAYIKRLMTSLDDDFNTQFYYPTFRKVREASQLWDVQMGQVETTTVLANNRAFAKVSPEATMEFDLPKRDIVIAEAMNGAKAMIDDFGALAQDPTFLAMAQLNGGQPTSSAMAGATGGQATVRNVLPGLSTDTAESVMGQHGPGGSQFGAAMEALIPDPAIYKFETGTGWEIRPVIQPDGQALVFDFNYMYTTNVREPVRADEKHLGRVKRHYVDTDVQLSNFELREISRYTVALKASRTSRGVPLFEDIPMVGVLFRPAPSDESSLQQNIILGQATIFPTVFDLMGLRWAPVVADLDPLRLSNDEFIVRNRRRALTNRVFDHSSSEVDKFLRIPDGERRMDLYRSQETIPAIHPNGYQGPGANLRDSQLQEGYDPTRRPETQFVPSESIEGSPELRSRRRQLDMQYEVPLNRPHSVPEDIDHSSYRRDANAANGVANVDYRSRVGASRYPGQQTEYVSGEAPRTESPSSPRMQRLPAVDAAHRAR